VGRSTVREVSADSSGSSAGYARVIAFDNQTTRRRPRSRQGAVRVTPLAQPEAQQLVPSRYCLLQVLLAREGLMGFVGLANTSRVENVCTTDERFRIASRQASLLLMDK
jgi:hypothetical protein